ncbi:hypothetical protein C4544_05265 [candidate division WS5 bacterium]|uniref:Peptidoglycan binding-like domain-containing protein n=1 Tax=candidate division WS5 bacterium TaxID=2093353 RepID=A0A419DB94_9BACT|nr:MAG: hypothetical protein C4544_05265 [candidate division WS5 bacterium]
MKYLKILILSALLLPSLSFAFESDLKYGSSGPEVTELQEFLTDKGYYSGPITGFFYSLTRSAVIKFQQANSISPAYGYFGPMTRSKANEIIQAENTNEETQEVQEQGKVTNASQDDAASTLQAQIDALLLQIQQLNTQVKEQTKSQQEMVGALKQDKAEKYVEYVPAKKSVLDITIQEYNHKGSNHLPVFRAKLYNRGNKTISISGGKISIHNATSTLDSLGNIEGTGLILQKPERTMTFDQDIMIPGGGEGMIQFLVSIHVGYMNKGEILYVTLDSLRTDADEFMNSFPVRGITYEL